MDVICMQCGNEIGNYQPVDGKIVLLIGGTVPVRDAWGWCPKCGMEWQWHSSDKDLDRLIQRKIERQKLLDNL